METPRGRGVSHSVRELVLTGGRRASYVVACAADGIDKGSSSEMEEGVQVGGRGHRPDCLPVMHSPPHIDFLPRTFAMTKLRPPKTLTEMVEGRATLAGFE